jgi:hypothetical protein
MTARTLRDMATEEGGQIQRAYEAKPSIPQTHCLRCLDTINGTTPRVCIGCMTDEEKLTAQYGFNYAEVLDGDHGLGRDEA